MMASFQYDFANRLTSATGTTYQYDNGGNRIQSQTSEQTLIYLYDTIGSMSRMLMSKTQDGAITKYIYGNGLIAQENSSGYYSPQLKRFINADIVVEAFKNPLA
ncbi:hypothetical protein NDGK_01771 [Clostridiales bacterium CHKCI001]|nr:hypothetical protein NDGK_01771 [Clostridiales bacterium CHKCI001]